MTPRPRIRRRRSSSRHGHGTPRTAGLQGIATLVTTFLLAIVLVIGPLILGADRLWIELPLLCVVALLLLVQGLRLTSKPAAESLRRVDAIDLSVILFVLYTIVRWLTSPAEYFSRIEAMDIMAYAVVFLSCRYGMPIRKYCMVLLYLLVGLGVLETALGYFLVNHLDWTPFGSPGPYYAPRWTGTYGSPNNYVSLLVMAIGAALALGSFSKLAWPPRIILFYLALTMLVGVLDSGSRGGWLAFLAAIGALVIMGIRNGTMRWWVPVTGAVVLLLMTGLLYTQSPVAQARLTDPTSEIYGGKLESNIRVELARDAVRIARDHLLFGTGPGTFTFVHPRYQSSTFALKAELTHDDYLNCLDDYGVAGLAIALFFLVAVTVKFFSPLDVDSRWQDRVLVATGFAAWIALIVHSWVDFNLHIPANALLLFSLTGLALGRLKQEKEGHWSKVSLLPLGRWLGGGLILLSVLFGVEAARTALSEGIYEQTLASQEVVPYRESIEKIEQALDLDGGNVQALALLGNLHLNQAALQKTNEDQVGESLMALAAYQKAFQDNSLDDSLQSRMGMALDLMGKYSEALSHFQQAVSAQPYNGQFWYWLGDHYAKVGMIDEAKRAYIRGEQCPRALDRNSVPEPLHESVGTSETAVPATDDSLKAPEIEPASAH